MDGSMSVKRLLGLICIACLVALAVRAYILEAVYASTASMEPALAVKEFVFVVRCWYVFKVPQRGDVVLIRQADKGLIKRVIGLPGETLEVRAKEVWINGAKLNEPYAVHRENDLVEGRDEFPATVVPPGSYFVMGDNRDRSQDSRNWGPVKKEQITGKVVILY
jgi:signal peptidase I